MGMKLNFCTLFNSSYLSRGIAMYESLSKHCDDFHLYVYAFDDKCYDYLVSQKLTNLTVVSLKEFENTDLLRVKPSRSAAEYCWTCSASTIHHSINTYNLSNCTYIDADMLFYSNPKVLIDEMGDNSVLITAHRYTPSYDQSALSGRYCVQFVTIKNDERGMNVLNWWKDACIEWCYAKKEDGKFGDQKYLDEFTSRFEGVHELEHLGGGLAPWNIQQYEFKRENNKLIGIEISSNKKFDVVFFHYHRLKFYENNIVCLTADAYDINKQIMDIFYFSYIRILNDVKKRINKIDNSFDSHGNSGIASYKPMNILLILRFYLSGLKRSPKNIFGQDVKSRITHHYYFKND